jgi:hypothetical protein
MGRAWIMYGAKRSEYKVSVGNLKEGRHLEDPGINGKIILQWIFKRWTGGAGGGKMDCINLAQDRDRWQTLVNVVMNLRVP